MKNLNHILQITQNQLLQAVNKIQPIYKTNMHMQDNREKKSNSKQNKNNISFEEVLNNKINKI